MSEGHAPSDRPIEVAVDVLEPAVEDPHVGKREGDFAQEGCLFTDRLHKCHAKARACDCHRKTGKAGAGTDVNQGGSIDREHRGEEEGFAEVSPDDFRDLGGRGEVDVAVPALEELKVAVEEAELG